MRFLNLTEAKTERKERKEIRTDPLARLCRFLNHLRLKVVKRIAGSKGMKHKMTKYRMRGLLPKMFSSVHLPRYKKGQNKIDNKKVKALARHCFNQTVLDRVL